MKLLESKNIQALLLADAVITVFTVAFSFAYPDPLNVLIVVSGWTSLGALALSNVLVWRVEKSQLQVREMLGGRNVELILARLDKTLEEAEQFLSSPEFLALLEKVLRRWVSEERKDK